MWQVWLLQALVNLPAVIQGIQHIHGDAIAGADKKKLAMEALGLATGVAGQVVPAELQPAVSAATALASSAIDNTVALLKATGHMTSPTVTSIPKLAAPVSVARTSVPIR